MCTTATWKSGYNYNNYYRRTSRRSNMFTSNLHVSNFFFFPFFYISFCRIFFTHTSLITINRYANATLNQPCIIENTTYVTDLHIGDPNGDGEATYIMNIIKHNCRSPTLFFCDPEKTVGGAGSNLNPTCQPTKELKNICRFDAECASVCVVFFFEIRDCC